MPGPSWVEWQRVRLVAYWNKGRWFVRGRVRRLFGYCPGCPRKIKQGHKMDCAYARRQA